MKYRLRSILALMLALVCVIASAGCGPADVSRIGDALSDALPEAVEVVSQIAGVSQAEEADDSSAVAETRSGISETGDIGAAADAEDASDSADAEGADPDAELSESDITEVSGDLDETQGPSAPRDTDDQGTDDEDIPDAAGDTEALAEAPQTADSVPADLPEIGDEINGFTVTALTDFAAKNAVIVSMTHIKSGAELIYIACDDQDKAVNIYYRTPALNDKGIPHIFEHITLAGSGKYPNASLFDAVSSRTFNTYMNASTYQHMTSYNMSSLSADQLLNIMDLYMSGLTDPLALSDEHILKREAFRYELTSPGDDLSVTGAVFNEMEAANADIDAYARNAALKLLYPYSIMSYNSGGERDDIIEATLAELKSFHDTYYHPSNMLIVLYGDLDPDAFTEKLDKDYLSAYDKRDSVIRDDKYIPWEGYRKSVIGFPASEDTGTDGNGKILYVISLGEMDIYERELVDALAAVLSSDSSPVRKAVEQEFPDAVYDAYADLQYMEPIWCFELSGSDEGDADRFKEIVDQALALLTVNGLDKEYLKAYAGKERLSEILSTEEPGGIDLSNSFGLCWTLTGDALSYLDCYEAVENLADEADKGTLDAMIGDYLLYPDQSVLLEVNPEPGLLEANNEAFDKKLSAVKSSMSNAELAGLIGDTYEFMAWSELDEADAGSYLDAVSVSDIGELREEYAEAEVRVSDEEGYRSITAVIEGARYLSTDIYLDASTLEYDEIHDFVFLGELLGSLATGNYTAEEISSAVDINAYDLSIVPAVIYDDETGVPHPYLDIHAMEAEENIYKVWELIAEIMSGTDFSDTARIRNLASAAAAELKDLLTSEAYLFAVETGTAAADPDKMYEYHALYTDYLGYLNDISKMSENQIKRLSLRLSTVSEKLKNKNNLIFTAIGSEEALKSGRDAAAEFIEGLGEDELSAVDYTDELNAIALPDSISVAVNDTVNYNALVVSNDIMGFAGSSGADKVINSFIRSNITYPAFRYGFGAYGLMQSIRSTTYAIVSYRDPYIAESLDFYKSLPEIIESMEVTEEDLNDSILRVFSDLAYPSSALALAEKEISYILMNKGISYSEDMVNQMKDAKTVTPEDVYDSAYYYRKLAEEGVFVTAGSPEAIGENEDLYELNIDALIK